MTAERTPRVAPHIERLVPYTPGKPVEELERELGIRNAIKLASNENPHGPSPRVREALARAADATHRYPDASCFHLRAALAQHHAVSPSEVCVGNGSNEIIDLLARTFATPSDHAVFGNPSFVCYAISCTAANVPFTEVALRDRVTWNVDDLLSAVRPETRLLFLANPNNPTGAYVSRGELERLLRSLPSHVMPVLDEAYFDFADATDYSSALRLRTIHPSLVVLRTFSKAYGLAALRIGYAIASPAIVDYLHRVRAPFAANSFGQTAALAALGDQDHVRKGIDVNRAERTRVTNALRELGLTVAPSQANFVLVDFARPGKEVYANLLERGVIVRPMPAPIDTSLRITVGLPSENTRLLEAVRDLSAK